MRKRKRSRLYLAAILLILIGAFVAAVFAQRRLAGAVPGGSPVLSLTVSDAGFFVGTSKGAYLSKDGYNWQRMKKFGEKRTIAAAGPDKTTILYGETLVATSDFKKYDLAHGAIQKGAALTTDYRGNVYIAEDKKHLALIAVDGGLQRVTVARGPLDIVSIAAVPGDPVTLFSGGIRSGLWRSNDGGVRWRAVLKTPTRTVLVDPESSLKMFVGTAGGVFASSNAGVKWDYTNFKEPIEALAAHDGKIYALTADRLVYESPDGVRGWKRVPKPAKK